MDKRVGHARIPVIDLFAGPGGLGEGFSAFQSSDGYCPFEIKLSIEKDLYAHATLQLRSFFRQFDNKLPAAYYEVLRNTQTPLQQRLDSLFGQHPIEAQRAEAEAWRAELGKEKHSTIRERINNALGKTDPWVLIGGPPCQAYSLAGRSRNKGKAHYKPDQDAMQFLYVEYLHVIAEHRPSVFIMENVKGLLSATVKKRRIFERILTDLKDPVKAIRHEGRAISSSGPRNPKPCYKIFSLSQLETVDDDTLQNFVVRMEHHGIPQARHRLILLGIRTDVTGSVMPSPLATVSKIPVRNVLEGLPRVRSGLSRETDSAQEWLHHLRTAADSRWFKMAVQTAGTDVCQLLHKAVKNLTPPRKGRGGEFVKCLPSVGYASDWYLDSRLEGVCNHTTRSHIIPDLHRYLYASCFGRSNGRSPVLSDFPTALRPNHQNVKNALGGSNFADRFRVQLADRPSTTVTSHIAKDGHYYIHYDPTQCRSLTVREAARLQTFPDNYFFCGPRTAQYAQVGNAVPPLLARQIADIVLRLLKDAGTIN